MRLRRARHRIVVSLFPLPICRGEMLLSSLYCAANTIIGRWGREWYLDLPGMLPLGLYDNSENAVGLGRGYVRGSYVERIDRSASLSGIRSGIRCSRKSWWEHFPCRSAIQFEYASPGFAFARRY